VYEREEGTPSTDGAVVWKFGAWQRIALVTAVSVLIFAFFDALKYMVLEWRQEEYSHGYMLPVVAAFLVWQRSSEFARLEFSRSWRGLLLALVGLILALAGEVATLFTVTHYGVLIALGGILLALMGWRAFRVVLPAYILLFFTVPLPDFLYNNLASQLQLVSSRLGVDFIRWFGISVYLEGNVIDLGSYQLQVVEACSGLRYLFPFSALGFIAAVLFRGALWKKAMLFLSTIPITMLMNSFRIGVIGILVNRAGVGMADGFLHDFEGWVVFMACTAILIVEMWLLAKVGRSPIPLSEAFAIEGPPPLPAGARVVTRRLSASFYPVLPLLAIALVVSQLLPERQQVQLQRADLALFPMDVGDWRGKRGVLETKYLNTLKLTDYLVADYSDSVGISVNFYVAYYDSQRSGVSAHSPKTCLPGGGWRIEDFSQREIPEIDIGTGSFRVNRSLIQMGDERLLVYYWFQQRGRVIDNEYLVKWYLFWDSLTRNRTDGALVRIATAAPFGADLAEKDQILQGFIRAVESRLDRFVPN
jgi:exosortase D (VPLPA-CTERM-specific)